MSGFRRGAWVVSGKWGGVGEYEMIWAGHIVARPGSEIDFLDTPPLTKGNMVGGRGGQKGQGAIDLARLI